MNQNGSTLLELLVGVGVGGIFMSAVVFSIFQITTGTAQSNGDAVALADMDKAAHWLTRDISQAQTTNLVGGAPAVSDLTLTWDDLTDWAAGEGNVSHSVTYTFSEPQLQRYFDGGATTTVGLHLTRVDFSISGRVVTITLTSSPDSYFPRPTETRKYVLYLRPAGPA